MTVFFGLPEHSPSERSALRDLLSEAGLAPHSLGMPPPELIGAQGEGRETGRSHRHSPYLQTRQDATRSLALFRAKAKLRSGPPLIPRALPSPTSKTKLFLVPWVGDGRSPFAVYCFGGKPNNLELDSVDWSTVSVCSNLSPAQVILPDPFLLLASEPNDEALVFGQ